MKVKVTAEDLIAGRIDFRAERAQTCPVALALNRALGRNDLCVGASRVWTFESPICEADLPPDVREKIALLDSGVNVEPFEFEVCLYSTLEMKYRQDSRKEKIC